MSLARVVFRPVLIFLTPAMKFLFSAGFDRRIMTGELFDGSLVGYRMLWRATWRQKVLGFNRKSPWPMAPSTLISDYSRLHFPPEAIGNLNSPGCYYQNFDADIYIGRGTFIAPNVGLITANHTVGSLSEHDRGQDIRIGEDCWIGMNAVILPGVTLGPNTVVGAGAVVTKSYADGNCVIVGNPGRIIKKTAS